MHGAWLRSGVWLVALCAVVCAAAAARAQAPTDSSAVARVAADSAYAPRYRFSPVFTNKVGADVSKVGMSNEMHLGLMTPWGSIFDFAISDDEKNYRLQNQFEQTKLMRLTDLHTFNLFWNGSANYSDSRVFSRQIAVGGGVTDFIINDKQINLNSTYKRKLYGARTDLNGTGGAIESQRAFKEDRGLQAGVNGGLAYNLGDHITWQGRGALRGSRDQSFTSTAHFDSLGSSEDSVSTKFAVQATDSVRFEVSHLHYHGDREFADQSRTSQGSQINGAENVFAETEHRDSRNTTLTMASRVFSRMRLTMTAQHDENKDTYDIQDTRFSRTVLDGVSGNVTYTLPWKTLSSVQFENNSTLRDLGTLSKGSYTDKRKRVGVSASHQFSKTFSLDLQGSTQLSQTFYVDQVENPRDRDQVDNNLSLRVTSTPMRKILASISAVYTYSDFVNIKASQSGENRTRTLWELRPAFTYAMNDRVTIVQNYGLTFDYTDYAFKNTQNYLDRNLTFSNEIQYRPTKTIATRFKYDFLLHDNGSYLPNPDTGVDELSVKNKDRRDRTAIRVDYSPLKTLAFFAENLYSSFQNGLAGSGTPDVSTDGQVELGTRVNYDWGPGKYLRMTVSHVKRFSPFGAEAEKDYWNANSEFSYPF